VKWSEVLWWSVCVIIDLSLRSFYVCCCVVCCLFIIFFVSFALCCVLITRFMFYYYSLHVCLLVLYFFLSSLYVLCFCIASSHAYSCFFYILVQGYRLLPLGGNPIAVNKYHIRSYFLSVTFFLYLRENNSLKLQSQSYVVGNCFWRGFSLLSVLKPRIQEAAPKA
jgi:hypothetical protein